MTPADKALTTYLRDVLEYRNVKSATAPVLWERIQQAIDRIEDLTAEVALREEQVDG